MTISHRHVNEAFLVANNLKDGWRDLAGFELCLSQAKENLAKHSDANIESQVNDHNRRIRYQKATWTAVVVQLDQCSVWNHMGKRKYATGPVPQVAERFLEFAAKEDRIHEMLEYAKLRFYDKLPLIVFKRKKGPGFRSTTAVIVRLLGTLPATGK